jgi:DNA-binding response OmpR family regulator
MPFQFGGPIKYTQVNRSGTVRRDFFSEEIENVVEQLHILLVDNSRLVTSVIDKYLSQAGYLVIVKDNLLDALDWLRKPGNHPDLVIFDEKISGMNDHELIRQVRARPADVYPPIILLASKDDISHKIAGFEAGADDYLVKPVSVLELGLRVKAVLSRAQAWRPIPVSSHQ